MKAEDHFYATCNVHNGSKPPDASRHTALGGYVGYMGYQSRNYGYSYANGYYAGYPRTYNTSYGYRPYYSSDYGRY